MNLKHRRRKPEIAVTTRGMVVGTFGEKSRLGKRKRIYSESQHNIVEA